jgi:hypothetical protein
MESLESHQPAKNQLPEQNIVQPILSVTTEGKKVVVHTTWRGQHCELVLSMKNEWLMITERMHMVRPVTHRFYREKQAG